MAMFVENCFLPERLGIESRLDDSATTTFLGPTDTIFGDTVGLRHPRRGSGESPTDSARRSDELGRVITIEALDLVMRCSKMLEGFNCVVGCFCSFRVNRKPFCGSVVQGYGHLIRGEVGIVLIGLPRVFDEVVASDLVAKLLWGRWSTFVGDELRCFLPFVTTLHFCFVADVAVRVFGEVGHHVPPR